MGGLNSRYQTAFLEILETALLALFIFFATRLVVQNFRVQGPSMRPTLSSSELVLVGKLSYFNSSPNRGDVVVFRKPGGDKEDLVKRVIGLPNELIEIRNGSVFVNGRELDESAYLELPGRSALSPRLVPPGNVFLLGDNRSVSEDSRKFGPVPLSAVVGKIWVIYWPFSQFGSFRDLTPTLLPAPVRSAAWLPDRAAA